jgi:phage shock protein PspC (stress-responsive transcriptional regulator)
MFSGLCAGLGEFVGLDATIVRLIFALSTIFTFPIPIIIYLVMILIVPEEPEPAQPVSHVEVIEQ